MVLLIHHNTSPHSRKIRIIMAEKKMLFVLREEEPWNLSKDIKKLNPSGELPVFIFDGGSRVVGIDVIRGGAASGQQDHGSGGSGEGQVFEFHL